MKAINSRHPLDIALILDKYGAQFLDKHKLCPDQLKAFWAIRACRTAAMGGHTKSCDHCNHKQAFYKSCRNRHCNKCQYLKQLVWVDKLKSTLPVCRYFHLVFTIPSSLHKLFYINQQVCYDLLFKASSQTLKKVSSNPKFLGAETGAVALLHTWGQALTYHPHIHMIVPAGGLSADGVEWVEAGKKFFLPVKALSKVFRGVMWDLLERHISSDNIRLPDDADSLAALKTKVYAKNWNVHTEKSKAGPQSVVQYLGKYTHRVAISNSRLRSIDNNKITFSWKNYRLDLKNRSMALTADEFIGRFMRHVLPTGFYRIRYYGLLASTNGVKKAQCMTLINKSLPISLLAGLSTGEVLKVLTGRNAESCPKCKKGKMLPHTILDPV